MSSFLGVLRKVAMFHKERKQVTIKQTTSPQKAGNSVTSGNSYPKSSKKDQIGRGRVPYHGAITERDFENIHHRIVRTSKASSKNSLKRVLVLVKVSLLCLRYRCILFCKVQQSCFSVNQSRKLTVLDLPVRLSFIDTNRRYIVRAFAHNTYVHGNIKL